MKVSLFITCLIDMFQPEVGKDTVELLEHLGCKVDFPKGQTCCGQPTYNSGYVEDSKKTMKHMIEVFEGSEYVVSPSGSCVAMLREYPTIFSDDKEWEERAKKLAGKTYELTQFIVNVLSVEDVGSEFDGKATYHTSCHMTRLLGEKEAPYKLLKQVKSLELLELPNAHDCCGFGGTFSIKMSEISEQMVGEKMQHIAETGANVLIGADCGCLLNIGGKIDRDKKPIEVMHIASVLNSRKLVFGHEYSCRKQKF